MKEMRSMGTKHVCEKCGCRFYDMGQNPLACPKCGVAVETSASALGARRRIVSEKTSASRTATAAEVVMTAKVPDVAVVAALGEEALAEEAVEASSPAGGGAGAGEEDFAEAGAGKAALGDDGDDGDAEDNGDGDDEEEDLDEEMMVDEEDGEGESEEEDDDDDDDDEDGSGGEGAGGGDDDDDEDA